MIDPAGLSALDRYRLITGVVVPRPVAWITTQNAAGVVNLAPFSFFQGVTATPMTVMVCIAHREPEKDTLRNLRAHGEGVIHLAAPDQGVALHESGAEYPSDVSEVTALGLATLPSRRVAPPRLAEAPVALEVRVVSISPVGTPPTSLVLCEVVAVHLDPAVVDSQGMPDPERLRTVARLGGEAYVDGNSWTLVRRPRLRRPPTGPVG